MARVSSAHATRRTMLAGGFCACCLPRTGFSASSFRMQEVAPGIFLRRGLDADATRDNADAIANIGFVVGEKAVLVTDSGGSLPDGQWLKTEIRRVTKLPIGYVVLSHVHPDHIFGACAFLNEAPEFIGHHKLQDALRVRGAFYRKKLSDEIGAADVGPLVAPTRVIGPEGGTLDLGGRRITLRAHGTAHTTCDLSFLDHQTRTLFPADLLFVRRVPALDGSLSGWLKELNTLETPDAVALVPGHGPPLVTPEAIVPLRRYLETLRDETRLAIRNGRSLDQAINTVAAGERGKWALFDSYNARNVTEAYKELEWE